MVSCVDAVNHPNLLLKSILDVYEVFDHLYMLWMGTWVHPYTVTTLQAGAKCCWKIRGKAEPKLHHGVMS